MGKKKFRKRVRKLIETAEDAEVRIGILWNGLTPRFTAPFAVNLYLLG
ncbi:MAG TPA: hypothetical protein PLJ60_05735 [Chryseolinea sp.]|nr:hypothetical protein [Chryseolinea sp.]HPM29819.1 hypothetical protein [Chryseolinea sp.]